MTDRAPHPAPFLQQVYQPLTNFLSTRGSDGQHPTQESRNEVSVACAGQGDVFASQQSVEKL